MAYEIYANDMLLFRSGSEQFILSNPKLSLEINKAGSLTFDIAPNHPYYDNLVKLKTNIVVYRDNKWLWSGRILNDTQKINKIKSVTCEGEYNFLHDTIQRQAEYHDISVEEYFTEIINIHNAQVTDDRKFIVGTVNVIDNNDSLYRYSNYETTFDTIEDKLIDRLGGYIYIQHTEEGRVINYLQEYPLVNTQKIEFGKNIVDLSRVIDSTDVYTCLIPLGAKIEDESTGEVETQSEEETSTSSLEKRVTIESVNDGKDYIINEEAAAIYGMITQTKTWDNVSEPSNLLTKGYAELNSGVQLKTTIKLTAVDLSYSNIDKDKLTLGETPIIVKPHNIDEVMPLSKMTLNLTRPSSDQFTLGKTKTSLTEETAKVDKNIQNVSTEIVTDYVDGEINHVINPTINQLYSIIASMGDKILLQVSSDYLNKDEKETIIQGYMTAIQQTANDITFTLNESINTTNGDLEAYKQYVKKYIQFNMDGITIGEENSPFKSTFSNVKLSFFQNGQEVAYISNNKLYITNAHVLYNLAIGMPSSGYYDWIIRSNGNMSLKYRDKEIQ